MQVRTSLPIHPVSRPTTLAELQPGSLSITEFTPALPTTVQPLTRSRSDATALPLVIAAAKKEYHLNLSAKDIKLELCLVDWPEGELESIASKRLYVLRRRLMPIYRYVHPKAGEVWIDANKMKLLGVRPNPSNWR